MALLLSTIKDSYANMGNWNTGDLKNAKFCKIDIFINYQSDLLSKKKINIIVFPVWLRNRLLSAGLAPVLNQTEKSCIASNYRQFSTNIKRKIIKLKPSFVSPDLRPLAADKTGFNLKIFHFDIRGKLSIIRCDKYILHICSMM